MLVIERLQTLYPCLRNPSVLARLQAAFEAMCPDDPDATLESCEETMQIAKAAAILAEVAFEAKVRSAVATKTASAAQA